MIIRDIKFRGMKVEDDELTGEWLYGNLIDGDRIVGKVVEWDSDYFYTEFWWTVDPRTVGQYTGKNDANGIEGYHKDLWEYHGVIYTIEWDEDRAELYLKHPHPRATDDDHIEIAYLAEGEIIGNIFESSNLLEDKQ